LQHCVSPSADRSRQTLFAHVDGLNVSTSINTSLTGTCPADDTERTALYLVHVTGWSQ
jgi:hypothetical protein